MLCTFIAVIFVRAASVVFSIKIKQKEGLYYQIINERYLHKRPIIFSSNEDAGTLSEKIGYAASSRLTGMCGDRLYQVEGNDYRLRKG
jgi:DNA replication protein DnaC